MIPAYTCCSLSESNYQCLACIRSGILVGLHRYSHARPWHGEFFDIHALVLFSHMLIG